MLPRLLYETARSDQRNVVSVSPLKNDLLLRALMRQPVPYTPTWLMRQAELVKRGRAKAPKRPIRSVEAPSGQTEEKGPSYGVFLTTLGSPGLGRSPLEQYLDFSESLIEAFFRLSCRRRPKRAWHEGVPEAQISSSFLPCQSLLLTLRALRATQIIVRSTLQALEDFPSCEERCCCTGGGVSLSDVDRDGTLPPLRGARRSNPPVR